MLANSNGLPAERLCSLKIVFGTKGRVTTVVAPSLSARWIKLGYETFGLYRRSPILGVDAATWIDFGRTSCFGRELHPQNTAPANLNALTVRSGETYAFTTIRESDQGVSLRQSNHIPP